jgi:protein-S-isoprenylcysteine O-methyltransferase Ste14
MVLLLGAMIFPTLIPLLLVLVLPRLDRLLGIPSLFFGPLNIFIGVIFILAGGSLAIWTISLQIRLASGTPFPMLPTKKLLIVGPFKYCRNPMTLGTVAAYGGTAILVGSVSALLAVAVLTVLLICYLKLIEEKELLLRFGSEYLDYKANTPFIIPVKIKQTGRK